MGGMSDSKTSKTFSFDCIYPDQTLVAAEIGHSCIKSAWALCWLEISKSRCCITLSPEKVHLVRKYDESASGDEPRQEEDGVGA